MSTDADRPADDCLADWCAGAEWCGLTCALDVLDRKWSPVVVALLVERPRGFAAVRDAIDGVSATVLSETLEDLTDAGVVERRTVSERPHRVEYRLTDAGRDLGPAIEALQAWGARHGTD
ncbi:MAG: winged helix-turn-helix transcriptional regulator [Haloglomus sp.]